jgi:hypothetical protein
VKKSPEDYFLIRAADPHPVIRERDAGFVSARFDGNLHKAFVGRVFNGVFQQTGTDFLQDAPIDPKQGIFVEFLDETNLAVAH